MAPITHADEAALTQRLDDLGRRIDAAQQRAAATPAPAPAPAAPAPTPPGRDDTDGGGRVWILLVIVLLGVIAGVAGVGALAGGDDDGRDRATTPAVVEEPAAVAEQPAAAAEEPPVAAAPAAPVTEPSEADAVAEEPAPAPAPPVVDASVVTVVEGDSFWAIAEREVADELGRAPTDAEVTTYWAQLLDLNADRLVEPGNPNLILPGQQLVVAG